MSSSIEVLRRRDTRRLPWRNGRGVTEEICIHPENLDFRIARFAWRVSKSGVIEPGPFSSFPGYDRWIVILEGAGLRLVHDDVEPGVLVQPFRPYRFSGDAHTFAHLVDGPVTDFNLFLRNGLWDGNLTVLRSVDVPCGLGFDADDDGALIHAVGGTIRVSYDRSRGEPPGRKVQSLEEGDSLRIGDPSRPSFRENFMIDAVDPSATAVISRIRLTSLEIPY